MVHALHVGACTLSDIEDLHELLLRQASLPAAPQQQQQQGAETPRSSPSSPAPGLASSPISLAASSPVMRSPGTCACVCMCVRACACGCVRVCARMGRVHTPISLTNIMMMNLCKAAKLSTPTPNGRQTAGQVHACVSKTAGPQARHIHTGSRVIPVCDVYARAGQMPILPARVHVRTARPQLRARSHTCSIPCACLCSCMQLQTRPMLARSHTRSISYACLCSRTQLQS